MPLIPYVPFSNGTPFTAEAANEIARPVFDGQTQYLGHQPKIADGDLSDDPTAIKARVASNETNLKVIFSTGLNVIVSAGRAILGVTVYYLNTTSVAVPASSDSFIYVDGSGTIVATTDPPPIVRGLLAKVTTNTTGVVNIVDQREGYKIEPIKPLTTTVRNFGGRGDAGAFVQTIQNQGFSDGEYYFTDFTVPSGFSLYINKLARIYCSGKVNIAGNIVVTTASAGAPEIAVVGILGVGGAGSGIGGGQGENPTETYNHVISPVGSGGGGGYVAAQLSTAYSTTTKGGGGGGCLWIEAAGAITVAGLITAPGGGGVNARQRGSSGSWTVAAGGGGGSGGLILLKSLTAVNISGTLAVEGGAGGSGLSAAASEPAAEAGSGGGGGRIVIYSPSVNTTGSVFLLSGGLGGGGFNSQGIVTAIGGTGGSYGGVGGTQTGNGVAGGAGETTIRYFTPLG